MTVVAGGALGLGAGAVSGGGMTEGGGRAGGGAVVAAGGEESSQNQPPGGQLGLGCWARARAEGAPMTRNAETAKSLLRIAPPP